MKLLHSLGFLVIANAAALSVPTADIPGNINLVSGELVGYGTNEVEVRTPNEAKVLEARVAPNCRRIGRVISRISKSSAVYVAYHLLFLFLFIFLGFKLQFQFKSLTLIYKKRCTTPPKYWGSQESL